MKKVLRYFIGLAAAVVFLYSGTQLFRYFYEAHQSQEITGELFDAAITVNQDDSVGETAQTERPEETEGALTPPLIIDFDRLLEECPDIVAWIYIEDTPVSYPIVLAEDNEYYLHRLPDGSSNSAGTLFADFRNARDFSDLNTIIYGHNMKNGSMFGTLTEYGDLDYRKSHPWIWIFTPEKTLLAEAAATCTIAADSDLYSFPQSPEDYEETLETIFDSSISEMGIRPDQDSHYLTLSTCSYEFPDARFVLIGKLKNICFQEMLLSN